MRPDRKGVVLMYLLAIVAIAFYLKAWICMGDVAESTRCVAHGCFSLLLSIWMGTCS